MTTPPPKRRAPRLMGIAVDNRKLGLAVLDPWELRGAITLNLRHSPEDLKLKIFAFVAQEKPRIIVLEEKNNRINPRVWKIISALVKKRNLDTVRIQRQESLKHFSASSPDALKKRLKKLLSESVNILNTPAAHYACANAMFTLHTQEFPSRTYVKPTPGNKNKDT